MVRGEDPIYFDKEAKILVLKVRHYGEVPNDVTH